MPTLRNFEDIEAWKKGRALTKSIYRITSQGPFAKDFGLKDQIRRASVSIISNIAEGYERGGDKEFIQFLSLAKGSSGEVRAQLYVAYDAGFITQPQLDQLRSQVDDVSRLIGGFMRYLQGSGVRGQKYKSRVSRLESRVNDRLET
ncbi:MAG: four helix bundle protein [Candidatus Sericytochromatia bacterium]